jgi:tRNA pseudouridine synthase 10
MERLLKTSRFLYFILFLLLNFRSSVAALKEGEDQKRKTYTALCVIADDNMAIQDVKAKLEPTKDLEIAQQTPIRVLHRRTDAKRMRTVYHMEVTPLDHTGQHYFLLKLATQAGTYVKEFVHGDFGRTEPNIAKILGCDVDILALDVEVRYIWY